MAVDTHPVPEGIAVPLDGRLMGIPFVSVSVGRRLGVGRVRYDVKVRVK